jgi:hypothetical protein
MTLFAPPEDSQHDISNEQDEGTLCNIIVAELHEHLLCHVNLHYSFTMQQQRCYYHCICSPTQALTR